MIDIKNSEELKEKLLAADVAVIDFWADWCGPCKAMQPTLETLQANNPTLVIGKINCDESQELAKSFGVRAIPTLVLLKKGHVAGTRVGALTLDALTKFVNG